MVAQSQYSAPDPLLDQEYCDEQEQEEDALSLCDLALDDYEFSDQLPPSSSSEFFEFFSGGSQLCPAEDIIFCGKLVPYQSPPPPPAVPDERQSALRKRSESLPELQSRRRSEEARHMMRNSRSLDYQRSPEIEKKASAAAAKPRWYLLMFGMVKVPSEMELRDMKSRQFRRGAPASAREEKGSAWGLLKALSCKDHTSVAVTTPFGRRVPET